MGRKELYEALKAKKIFDVRVKDPLWDQAFALYYKETRQRLSPSCGGCWPKIRSWLQA